MLIVFLDSIRAAIKKSARSHVCQWTAAARIGFSMDQGPEDLCEFMNQGRGDLLVCMPLEKIWSGPCLLEILHV